MPFVTSRERYITPKSLDPGLTSLRLLKAAGMTDVRAQATARDGPNRTPSRTFVTGLHHPQNFAVNSTPQVRGSLMNPVRLLKSMPPTMRAESVMLRPNTARS